MSTQQADIFATSTNVITEQATNLFTPLMPLVESTIRSIEALMNEDVVLVLGSSYGKDSGSLSACTLEAARRFKQRNGYSPVIRVSTIDTLVDNPMAMGLARKMSEKLVDWSKEQGLDVRQVWASPSIMNRYLVKLLGGRDIATVAGGDSRCAVDMKIRPVQALKARLKREFKGRKIVTLIGTRHSESTFRNNSMNSRGERADEPVLTQSGDWLMSPLANWELGHVWGFIDKIMGGDLPFPVYDDFVGLAALYEAAGESTCSADAFSGQKPEAGLGCGSGGRMGCWMCQKTSADHSLIKLLDQSPQYGPLVRLSQIIRAGHDVPENRSFVGRSMSDDGFVSITGNAYSPGWQAQLLKLALSADQDELDWAEEESDRLGRAVAPRFRVITDEEVVAIAFMWGRYGLHPTEEAMAIAHSIRLGGRRYEMSDDDIEALVRKQDRPACSRSYGRIKIMDTVDRGNLRYTGRIDAVAHLSGVATTLATDSVGTGHSPILTSGREMDVNLGSDPDLAMWHLMDTAVSYADRARLNGPSVAYLDFLLRQDVISFPAGYLGRMRDYAAQASALLAHEVGDVASDPASLASRPGFVRKGQGQQGLFQVDKVY